MPTSTTSTFFTLVTYILIKNGFVNFVYIFVSVIVFVVIVTIVSHYRRRFHCALCFCHCFYSIVAKSSGSHQSRWSPPLFRLFRSSSINDLITSKRDYTICECNSSIHPLPYIYLNFPQICKLGSMSTLV